MSFVIHYTHAYAFLGGLFISKFTNIFSDIVISGLVIYIVTPEKYNEKNWNRLKSYYNNLTGFLTSRLVNKNMIENTPEIIPQNKLEYQKPENYSNYKPENYPENQGTPNFLSNNPYKFTSLPKIETMGK